MSEQEQTEDIPQLSDSDSSEDESNQAEQVESLVAGRERRKTAGNRYDRETILEEAPEDDDPDEVALLFADNEDEEDEEFKSDDPDDDADMSSSDDDDQGPNAAADDFEGEKEIIKQAKDERSKKRKADLALTSAAGLRKKLKTDPTHPTSPAAKPKPSKKKERVTWVHAQDSGRSSLRKQTIAHRAETIQRLKESEAQSKKLKALKEKRDRERAEDAPKELTQADRLAEAARVERQNAKSLNRWEALEKKRQEEQAAKLAALKNRKLEGPVVSWWSAKAKWIGPRLNKIGTKDAGNILEGGGIVTKKKPGRKTKAELERLAAEKKAAEESAAGTSQTSTENTAPVTPAEKKTADESTAGTTQTGTENTTPATPAERKTAEEGAPSTTQARTENTAPGTPAGVSQPNNGSTGTEKTSAAPVIPEGKVEDQTLNQPGAAAIVPPPSVVTAADMTPNPLSTPSQPTGDKHQNAQEKPVEPSFEVSTEAPTTLADSFLEGIEEYASMQEHARPPDKDLNDGQPVANSPGAEEPKLDTPMTEATSDESNSTRVQQAKSDMPTKDTLTKPPNSIRAEEPTPDMPMKDAPSEEPNSTRAEEPTPDVPMKDAPSEESNSTRVEEPKLDIPTTDAPSDELKSPTPAAPTACQDAPSDVNPIPDLKANPSLATVTTPSTVAPTQPASELGASDKPPQQDSQLGVKQPLEAVPADQTVIKTEGVEQQGVETKTDGPLPESLPEPEPVIEHSTRNLVILEKFEGLSNQERQEFSIFYNQRKPGKAVKSLKHSQELCPITALPVRYRDPDTGIGYATAAAYKKIHEVKDYQFSWSSMLGCYVGRAGAAAARGVPEGFLQE